MKTIDHIDRITIIDATPAMADVLSGAVEAPREFDPMAPGHGYRGRDCWWHWATRSLAGRRALAEIGCTVDPERPWNPGANDWYCRPWLDSGVPDTFCLFDGAGGQLRAALGVPGAGVFYVERCVLDALCVQYKLSDPAMVAINEDGTRAAIARLAYRATERKAQ